MLRGRTVSVGQAFNLLIASMYILLQHNDKGIIIMQSVACQASGMKGRNEQIPTHINVLP